MNGLSTRSQKIVSSVLVGVGIFGLLLAIASLLFDDGSDVITNLVWGGLLLIVGISNLIALSRGQGLQRERHWRGIAGSFVLMLVSTLLIVVGIARGGPLLVIALISGPLLFIGGAFSLVTLMRSYRA